MGYRNLLMVLVLLIFIMIGCKKNDKNLLHGEWKATYIVYECDTVYPIPTGRDITIDFSEKGHSYLKLDVNDRYFDYKLGSNKDIKINFGPITLVCCDNDFSDKVEDLFRETSNYEFKSENNLILLGNGQISLERQNEK